MGRDRPDPNEAVQRRVRRHRLGAQGQRRRGAGAAKRQGRRADRVGARQNLGAAGHNCRVAFGSYVGDGNVGQAAPTTLASPFYPVLVLVQRVISGNNSIANPSVFVRPNDKGTNAADKSTMDSLLYLTWADDSVSWYSYNTGGAYAQLNTYGTTYLYIILGYDKATEDAE